MPSFSTLSTKRLNTCDFRLNALFQAVVRRFDCAVLEGRRGPERQAQLFDLGLSKLRYPNSKHNAAPSLAVDIAPYPVDWSDHSRFYLFAGYVLRTAEEMGLPIRWGGDWDSDFIVKDQNFNDLVHYEIIETAGG